MNVQEYCELFARCGLNGDIGYVSQFIKHAPPDEICIIKTKLVEQLTDHELAPRIPLSPSLYIKSLKPVIMIELNYNGKAAIFIGEDMVLVERDFDKIMNEINKLIRAHC